MDGRSVLSRVTGLSSGRLRLLCLRFAGEVPVSGGEGVIVVGDLEEVGQ